jgi:hypothetical protein
LYACLLIFAKTDGKYTGKAANEYKRHLARLSTEHETTNNHHASVRLSSHNQLGAVSASEWDSATGLDTLIKSLSGVDLSATAVNVPEEPPIRNHKKAPETIVSTEPFTVLPTQEDEELAEVQQSLRTAAAAASAAPRGMLSVDGIGDGPSTTSASQGAARTGFLKKPHSVAHKKTTGAKRLTTPSDIAIESFEATDRRVALAEKQAAVRVSSLAQTGTASTSAGRVSQVDAIYAESLVTSPPLAEVEAPSIYRSVPPVSSSASGNSSSAGRNSNNLSVPSGESTLARERYGAAKGISSTQFFGDPEADAAEAAARTRLTQFAHSTSISSSMLSGERQDSSEGRSSDLWAAGSSSSSGGGATSLGRWTQDLIRRIG